MKNEINDWTEAERAANAVIAKECAAIGIKIESPWDFVGYYAKPCLDLKLLEILSRNLTKDHPPKILWGIIFAVGKPEGHPFAFEKLIKLIYQDRGGNLAGIAANGLIKMLQPTDVERIVDIMMDDTLGDFGWYFLDYYTKIKKSLAIPKLRLLVSRNLKATKIAAILALGKLGDEPSRIEILKLTDVVDVDIKKAARAALKKLDKKLPAK
jgi:hypothetical protein